MRERGTLICAGRDHLPGFGYVDASGNNVGFEIDLCRAVATAVLGDANAIEVRLVTPAERGPAIQSGEVDLLVRLISQAASRDPQLSNYVHTMLFNGQGFIVRKNSGITRPSQLRGGIVCVAGGTISELNLQDFSRDQRMDIEVLSFDYPHVAGEAYRTGQCDSFTYSRTDLALMRLGFDNPGAHTILGETISEVPLGPVVPHGDDQWFHIVKAVMNILIYYGEAYGISSARVPNEVTGITVVDRMLGTEGSFGQERLGLSQTVAQDVLNAVGNYGEIYNRNLGPGGINLPRQGNSNALRGNPPCGNCPKGGQIYAVPYPTPMPEPTVVPTPTVGLRPPATRALGATATPSEVERPLVGD